MISNATLRRHSPFSNTNSQMGQPLQQSIVTCRTGGRPRSTQPAGPMSSPRNQFPSLDTRQLTVKRRPRIRGQTNTSGSRLLHAAPQDGKSCSATVPSVRLRGKGRPAVVRKSRCKYPPVRETRDVAQGRPSCGLLSGVWLG